MGTAQDLEVRVFRSVAEIETLRDCWSSWPGHRDSDIDFFLMIVDAYPDVLRPHVIALYRDGKLESILVGRLEKQRLAFEVGYLNLPRVSVRCLTFVYGAIHGSASACNTELLVRSVLDSLYKNEADLAFLEYVPLDSPLYRMALDLPGILMRDSFPAAQAHDSMSIPRSLDEIYRRMSSDRRIETRRRVRKLESQTLGPPKIICYRNESELELLFRHAEEIACKTYQRGLGAGFSDTEDIRRRLGLAARKGWLRAYLLYLADRPVAFWIGMLYRGTFVSEYMGYLPEFRQFSPGTVLIMKVIEGFCSQANGDTVNELDFGLGHAEYKAALCSKTWHEAPVYIFSSRPKGLLLKAMRLAARAFEAGARKALISTKLLPKLKRVWRDRLAKRKQEQSRKKQRTANVASPVAHPPVANERSS